MPHQNTMLPPDLIKKIKKMHIRTGRLVNTMMAGQYKSVFRGTGIEFEEVREYTPGDEVKNIDWKVSARMGRPFIKRFREERELVIMLLVDMSGSVTFGTSESLKRDSAAEAAAILAFNAIRNNDKVGAILFTDRVEKYIPPKKGAAHVWRVIKEIFAFRPTSKGTDVVAAVDYLGKVCPKRTVTFLVTDFLSPDRPVSKQEDFRPLATASKKHEMIAVLLSDPGDFRLPPGGILSTYDLETGQRIMFDASNRNTRKVYTRQRREAYGQILSGLKATGIDAIEVSTDAPVADALLKYFRYREKRKR